MKSLIVTLAAFAVLVLFTDYQSFGQTQNPWPTITSTNPAALDFDQQNIPVAVYGSGFVRGSVVMIDRSLSLTTTYVSPTELDAVVPASAMSLRNALNLSVFTPAPGGGLSDDYALLLNIDAELTSISPKRVIVGSSAVNLILSGRNFAPGVTVSVGDLMLSTTYVSDSTLIAIVPSEITSTVGSYEVDVVNPTQDLDDTDAVVRFVVYQRQIKILPGNKTTTMSAPLAYELHQNYPNPFNPTTTINFDLARPSTVTLKVYNSVGQEVATLADNTEMSQGSHFSTFDASNLASGTYIYRLSVTSSDNDQPQSYVSVKRMTLVK